MHTHTSSTGVCVSSNPCPPTKNQHLFIAKKPATQHRASGGVNQLFFKACQTASIINYKDLACIHHQHCNENGLSSTFFFVFTIVGTKKVFEARTHPYKKENLSLSLSLSLIKSIFGTLLKC
jgi:hypothetical protein